MNKEEKKKIPRIIKHSIGLNPGPVRIDLILTNKCNQKCGYCYLRKHSQNNIKELTKEEILKIIKEGANLGTYNWNLIGGGEPLYDSEKALLAMRAIKKHKMFGNLTTNGTLFKEKIIKEVINIKWDCVNFSIDSPNQKIQDQLRGQKGALKKASQNLEKFKELKSDFKSDKPFIVIHSVLTNKNYKNLMGLIKFAKDKGAEKLELTQVMSFSRSAKDLKLNEKEVKKFKKQIPSLLKFAKKINLNTNLHEYLDESIIKDSEKMDKVIKKDVMDSQIKTLCFNPWTSLIILNNGDVGPCCLYTPDKKLGNIREESLQKIWCGKKLKDFREKIKKHQNKSCKDCPSTEIIRNRNLRNKLEKSTLFKIFNFIKNEF